MHWEERHEFLLLIKYEMVFQIQENVAGVQVAREGEKGEPMFGFGGKFVGKRSLGRRR